MPPTAQHTHLRVVSGLIRLPLSLWGWGWVAGGRAQLRGLCRGKEAMAHCRVQRPSVLTPPFLIYLLIYAFFPFFFSLFLSLFRSLPFSSLCLSAAPSLSSPSLCVTHPSLFLSLPIPLLAHLERTLIERGDPQRYFRRHPCLRTHVSDSAQNAVRHVSESTVCARL